MVALLAADLVDPVVSAPALLAAVVLRLAQLSVHLLEESQEEEEVTPIEVASVIN